MILVIALTKSLLLVDLEFARVRDAVLGVSQIGLSQHKGS
jgi:hypothetical protein